MSAAGSASVWANRLLVAQALFALTLARMLVHHVRFSRWRGSLGAARDGGPPLPMTDQPGAGPECDDVLAHRIGRCVDRAAQRLPFETKCLVRAIAAQWMLRQRSMPSQLVIAVHVTDRDTDDGYHAWVQHKGHMIVGRCDPSVYQPVMILSQGTSGSQAASSNTT